MKKLIALLMVLLLTVALVGCGNQEPLKSDEGWALHYAIEYHEEHVERLPEEYGYTVERWRTVGLDDDCVKLSCSVLYFEVTITDGEDFFTYYVLIEVVDTIWKFYSEERIIQYDVDSI